VGTGLWDWHYSFVEGKGKRRDGMISLLNDLKIPVVVWYFRRGSAAQVHRSKPECHAEQRGDRVG
jgi:hypothetical protein